MNTPYTYHLSSRYYTFAAAVAIAAMGAGLSATWLITLLFQEPFRLGLYTPVMLFVFFLVNLFTTPITISLEDEAMIIRYLGRADVHIPYGQVLRIREHRIAPIMQRFLGQGQGIEIQYKGQSTTASLSFGTSSYINGEELLQELYRHRSSPKNKVRTLHW